MGSRFLPPEPLPPLGTLAVGCSITHYLAPGQRLRINAGAHSDGHTLSIAPRAGDPDPMERAEVPAGQNTIVGPFEEARAFRVHCDHGSLVVRVS